VNPSDYKPSATAVVIERNLGMEPLPSSAKDWRRFADKLGRRLKAKCREALKRKNEGDMSPEILAFREALATFPVSIRVLVVEGEKEFVTVIEHDLTRPGTTEAESLGVVALDGVVPALLQKSFGIPVARGLSDVTYYDSEWTTITTVVPYQVLDEFERYCDEFYRFLGDSFWNVIQDKFCKKKDYNIAYGLSPEQILLPAELLRYGQPLANVQTGLPPTIEEWQGYVNNILLIPSVPDSVQRTFEVAKQLFVFAYFVYSFSTASQHYAYLALEAALQARWSATLPPQTTVVYSNGVHTEFQHPTHKELFRHWKVDPTIQVNGERFPKSTNELIRALRRKQIIAPWQVERIQAGIDLRNDLSHLEDAQIMTASSGCLDAVAELINAMFDSVAAPNSPSKSANSAKEGF
jgi:hypothetical protein